MTKQVKSKQRVADHGEVFTAEREVQAMCDLVKQETERVDSRFLEPACGDGNFLSEILERKLTVVTKKYRRSAYDWERNALLALGSIYGVDIMPDNVLACQERLFEIWNKEYKKVCKKECNDATREAARFILCLNIVCGNALTLLCCDDEGKELETPIVFSEWTFPFNDARMQRNPYAALPRMVMLTYRIPDSIRQIAMQGEFNEFDLNVFFSAKGKGDEVKFVYENEVQKWLDLIRGSYLPSNIDDMKLGQDKRPPMPYSDTRLLNVLSHTLWFLPNVASCQAMYNLMMQKQNAWFNQRYTINVCAGTRAGIGLDALAPVQRSMGDPLVTQTITLSCGKLTTGVTVRPWTGVFMLRNLKSPETYFQTAFRVQSPWEITDESGNRQIMKQECYVFDFALDRALRQISDYSCRLDVRESNPEKKVAEFISFLPVLAYDGSSMHQISAQDILDIAMAGTSATLLAKRWESALLVNVDNDTLTRLMASKEAMDALMNIEGFRSLNQDIQTIINKSEAVKKAKKDGGEKTQKEKKELTEQEKEYKSMRKKIQEKLIKFATRVPIFMYLTDYRERSLRDVITQLEPGLFKKVTGLDVKDFELLCSLGVFNANLMNDAIFKFKRYEDSSLSYTGIDKHKDKDVGGWDTVIKREEYDRLFYNQQATMEQPAIFEVPVAAEDGPVSERKPVVSQRSVLVSSGPQAKSGEPRLITAQYGVKSPVYAMKVADEPSEYGVSEVPKIKIGDQVIHKTFGEGNITGIDKAQTHIRVTFAVGEKMFIYPEAFEKGFLVLKE